MSGLWCGEFTEWWEDDIVNDADMFADGHPHPDPHGLAAELVKIIKAFDKAFAELYYFDEECNGRTDSIKIRKEGASRR